MSGPTPLACGNRATQDHCGSDDTTDKDSSCGALAVQSCPTRLARWPSVKVLDPTTPRQARSPRSTTRGACATGGRVCVVPSAHTTRVGTSPSPRRTRVHPEPDQRPPSRRSAFARTAAGSGCARSSRSRSLRSAAASRARDSSSASACAASSRRRARPDPQRSPSAPASSEIGPSAANSSSCGPRKNARAMPTGTGATAASHGTRAGGRSGGTAGPVTRTSVSAGAAPGTGLTWTVPSPGCRVCGPGPPARRSLRVVDPMTTVDVASTAVTVSTGTPSTTTPLVDARSSTVTPLEPTAT